MRAASNVARLGSAKCLPEIVSAKCLIEMLSQKYVRNTTTASIFWHLVTMIFVDDCFVAIQAARHKTSDININDIRVEIL